MTELRFSREEDEELVELVRRNPALYDTSHKDYKDQVVRDTIWMAITDHMLGRSVEDCKKRWRSIRDTFNRQKKTLKKASIKYRQNTWPLASKMFFLNNVEQERSTTIKMKLESKEFDEDETEIGLSYVDVNDSIVNYNDEPAASPLEDENPLQNSVSLESHSQESSPGRYMFENLSSKSFASQATENGNLWGTNNYSCKKRKLNDRVLDTVDNGVAESRGMMKGEDRRKLYTEDFDSLEIFFKSMDLTLRQLQPALVAEAKIKICKIVVDLELKAIQLNEASISNQSSHQNTTADNSESVCSNDFSQTHYSKQTSNSIGVQTSTQENGDVGVPRIMHEDVEDSEVRTPITQSSSATVRSKVQQQQSRRPENEDEFDVVGRRVAYQLRGMEERQSLIAEKIVFDILFQGRLGKLKENSFVCLSPAINVSK